MPLTLKLRNQPEVPLEADCICPDRMRSLSLDDVKRLAVFHGNREQQLADFFDCSGEVDGDIRIEGDLNRVKHVGATMSHGSIHVDGHIGLHTGAAMSGGEIVIEGDAGDWLGPEMLGGKITVKGNAGHMVGSGYRGSTVGMQGGEILVHGNVKNETGHCMRRGLIAVGGNAGDFTGVNMLAGTIIICGEMGIRNGAGMKRGSIISFKQTAMLPTFSLGCQYRPVFLKQYLNHLLDAGFDIDSKILDGEFQRWCGDSVELNRGEILLYAGK